MSNFYFSHHTSLIISSLQACKFYNKPIDSFSSVTQFALSMSQSKHICELRLCDVTLRDHAKMLNKRSLEIGF